MQGEKDDKIIAVCADDPEFRHYKDIKELPPHRLAEIRRFFEDCILSLIYYANSLKLCFFFFFGGVGIAWRFDIFQRRCMYPCMILFAQ